MRRAACYLPLLTLECIVCDTCVCDVRWMCGVLESRTHGVELPEDFRSSFLAQRRVCEHRDVGAF